MLARLPPCRRRDRVVGATLMSTRRAGHRHDVLGVERGKASETHVPNRQCLAARLPAAATGGRHPAKTKDGPAPKAPPPVTDDLAAVAAAAAAEETAWTGCDDSLPDGLARLLRKRRDQLLQSAQPRRPPAAVRQHLALHCSSSMSTGSWPCCADLGRSRSPRAGTCCRCASTRCHVWNCTFSHPPRHWQQSWPQQHHRLQNDAFQPQATTGVVGVLPRHSAIGVVLVISRSGSACVVITSWANICTPDVSMAGVTPSLFQAAAPPDRNVLWLRQARALSARQSIDRGCRPFSCGACLVHTHKTQGCVERLLGADGASTRTTRRRRCVCRSD